MNLLLLHHRARAAAQTLTAALSNELVCRCPQLDRDSWGLLCICCYFAFPFPVVDSSVLITAKPPFLEIACRCETVAVDFLSLAVKRLLTPRSCLPPSHHLWCDEAATGEQTHETRVTVFHIPAGFGMYVFGRKKSMWRKDLFDCAHMRSRHRISCWV